MSYELIWEPRGVTKKFFGCVTSDDLIQSVVQTEGDSRFDVMRFVINDFLNITSVKASMDDIENISAIDSGAAMTNPRIKVAIVTISDEIVALATGYMNSPMNAYPTKIFATLGEARAWIV